MDELADHGEIYRALKAIMCFYVHGNATFVKFHFSLLSAECCEFGLKYLLVLVLEYRPIVVWSD